MKKIFVILILLFFFIDADSQSGIIDSVINKYINYFSSFSPEYYKNKTVENLKNESFIDAERYIMIAIALENDSIKKSNYFYLAAVTKFALNNYPESRDMALKSADFNPNFCKPYILIAKLYSATASKCFEDRFERGAVYWAAVDKLEKAKSIDNSCVEEADKLIKRFRMRFPDNGCFIRIHDGEDYFVGCWINEKTKTRFNNNQLPTTK